uniref:Putative RNA-binding protein Luc7-like 1 n=1 Tax=Aceria tosichella TaxID=561515 RepID=A0A6G1SNP7_9ACAR
MSATEHMRAMLDGLMGTARDGSDAKRQHLHFTDSRVCRAFLLDCCPHDIFASTKLELGECQKVHDPALRADYLLANKKEDLMYEVSALERVQAFVNEADKKTEYLKRKLAETQEELTAEETSKLNRVHELTEKLGKKLAQVDKAEADGDLDAKKRFLEESERIKKERLIAETEYRQVSRPASSHQHQNLRVCDVCSAYLGINDNDSRLADHYGGKLHLGFITVREKLEDLKKRCAEKTRNRDYDHGRSDRHHRDREREHDRDRDRDRDRGRERERIRDTDRDRIREDKYHERDRSRSSSRYYREPPRYSSRSRESHRDYAPRDHISRDYHRYRDDRVVERDRDRERDRERVDRIDRSERSDRSDRSDRHLSTSSRGSRVPFDRSDMSRYDEREIAYQRRLRDWEKREVEKARKHAIREAEERERKMLEEQETKKLKEFLEDYKDDRDDIRFYRGSALARRLADRQKELEQDEQARQKEKMELEMLSRSCAMGSSTPQPIEMANNDDGIVSGDNGDTTGDLVKLNESTATSNHRNDPLNFNATSSSTATTKQPSTANQSKSSNSEDKRKLVEELISRIPTDKDQLFAQKLDWSLLDDNLMEKRIRPWVTKKIAEYMGEKEADLIDFVCTLLSDHKDGSSMLKEVAIVLDDEAEKFVVHLWRLLIFELEAKKIGLRK